MGQRRENRHAEQNQPGGQGRLGAEARRAAQAPDAQQSQGGCQSPGQGKEQGGREQRGKGGQKPGEARPLRRQTRRRLHCQARPRGEPLPVLLRVQEDLDVPDLCRAIQGVAPPALPEIRPGLGRQHCQQHQGAQAAKGLEEFFGLASGGDRRGLFFRARRHMAALIFIGVCAIRRCVSFRLTGNGVLAVWSCLFGRRARSGRVIRRCGPRGLRSGVGHGVRPALRRSVRGRGGGFV